MKEKKKRSVCQKNIFTKDLLTKTSILERTEKKNIAGEYGATLAFFILFVFVSNSLKYYEIKRKLSA
ncbi:MAG: hypothetical protein R3Y11_08600 [Pseudomonadota bacterium]